MKMRELGKLGALLGMLGLGAQAQPPEGRELSPTVSALKTVKKDNIREIPPIINETPRLNTYETTFDNPSDSETEETFDFETQKNAVIALLEDIAGQKNIPLGTPEKGMGYSIMKLSGEGTEPQCSLEIFSDGKKYASIIIDEGGYTLRPPFGDKVIAVTQIKDLASVLDEYHENFYKLKTAYDKDADFDDQLQAQVGLQDTTYFKSTN